MHSIVRHALVRHVASARPFAQVLSGRPTLRCEFRASYQFNLILMKLLGGK